MYITTHFIVITEHSQACTICDCIAFLAGHDICEGVWSTQWSAMSLQDSDFYQSDVCMIQVVPMCCMYDTRAEIARLALYNACHHCGM